MEHVLNEKSLALAIQETACFQKAAGFWYNALPCRPDVFCERPVCLIECLNNRSGHKSSGVITTDACRQGAVSSRLWPKLSIPCCLQWKHNISLRSHLCEMPLKGKTYTLTQMQILALVTDSKKWNDTSLHFFFWGGGGGAGWLEFTFYSWFQLCHDIITWCRQRDFMENR